MQHAVQSTSSGMLLSFVLTFRLLILLSEQQEGHIIYLKICATTVLKKYGCDMTESKSYIFRQFSHTNPKSDRFKDSFMSGYNSSFIQV